MTEKTTMIKGQKQTLTVSGTKLKVRWSSSNPSVASVSAQGVLTAKRVGDTVVSATVGGKKFSETVTVERFLWQRETQMNSELKNLLELCCSEKNIPHVEISSGAGHDAINMALFTPTAMLFIPSIGGISHSILEKSCEKDIEIGTNLLLEAVLKLDARR